MLLICAVAALAAALMSGRWALIAFAAPLLGVLCSAGWQRPLSSMVVRAAPEVLRCFEGEREHLEVELRAAADAGSASLEVTAPDGMGVELLESGDLHRQAIAVSADRWGRFPLRARVDVVAPGGLLAASGSGSTKMC